MMPLNLSWNKVTITTVYFLLGFEVNIIYHSILAHLWEQDRSWRRMIYNMIRGCLILNGQFRTKRIYQ